jgi:hypothetical protein
MKIKPIIKVINENGEIRVLKELPQEEQDKICQSLAIRLIEAFADLNKRDSLKD